MARGQEDQIRYKTFTRRSLLLGGGQAVLLSTLAGRLYYLQILEADRYATLAEDNRINLRLIAPPRGRILDRFGVPLAVNVQNYRVVLVREQTPDVDRTLDALGQIIDLTEGDRERPQERDLVSASDNAACREDDMPHQSPINNPDKRENDWFFS